VLGCTAHERASDRFGDGAKAAPAHFRRVLRRQIVDSELMILVSGATGTAGKEIVLQMASLGIPVKALVRDMAKATPFRGKCVHVTVGDLNEMATLDEAFKEVDRALLLPANNANQVEQERTFIDAAKRAGVQHIVKFSALGADDPQSGSRIIRWHAEAEDYLEASGLAWTHLRPCMFMQNLLGSPPL